MFTLIIKTKLHIPSLRQKLVVRPRLMEKLNESLESKLILVSAPAGFSKTSLVCEWLSECRCLVAWLSLDEGDSDPIRFLNYMIAALQTISKDVGNEALKVVQTTESVTTINENILTTLLNDISTINEKFILVLDDYHLINSKKIDFALTFFIDHMPAQMSIIITTREDPNLPLARLRARGQLTELREADLRFTPKEAGEFLNQVMNLNLSEENISALENRTEGWIAGLQLAALSMQGREDINGFIRAFTGSHRFVLDYLVEEVLKHQPDHIRYFLLQTSILSRLSGQLCNYVTGIEDSVEILDLLEQSNLFIIPLDDQRQWYRYHHLFTDMLLAYLIQTQPDSLSNLHKRASTWYEKDGKLPDAIHHALAAKDFERAAKLVELAIPEMRRNRQGATVTELGWLKELPEELIYFRPVLCVDYAYALFAVGELDGVEKRLNDAERWLNSVIDNGGLKQIPTTTKVVEDQEEFRRLPGMIALLRAAKALIVGDTNEIEKNARKALENAYDNDYLLRGGAATQLALASWAKGDLDEARNLISIGIENVRKAGYTSAAIGGVITLADIQIAKGELANAMATFQSGLQLAKEFGTPILPGTADMYVGMSSLYYEYNDLQAAKDNLLKSQTLGKFASLPQNPYRWHAMMARISEAQGDLDGALDLFNKAEQLYDGNFSPNIRPISTCKIKLLLAQGKLSDAQAWVQEHKLTVEDELSFIREFDHITLTRVLLADYLRNHTEDSIIKAMALLERLRKAAEEGRRKRSVIEILMLQALVSQAQGDISAALLPLQDALLIAEPEGFIRTFVDEGTSMKQLLQEASSRGIMPDYSGRLLAAFEEENQNIEKNLISSPDRLLNDLLSHREFEILKLISLGLSNREIGERLFLAIDTVKGHNRRIFDKLQVESRTEAIARARELGLI
ncbi:MAG: helix-turn-helix transcriptional regulator [Anaerolinea sp.]|nr:helix-turn-helix transcriptional regulator [Anaerolinea sp.]